MTTDKEILELVGRMLMIGLNGENFSRETRELLLDVRPGGIILFKRNVGGGPAQVASLINSCQEISMNEFGRPLLTAIDQEGGPVRRLDPPFSVLPSQREMAEKLDQDEVRVLSSKSGRELAAVGINLNLAPVLDMLTEEQATFMAERSFGPDPEVTAKLGEAVIDGHAEHGVLTCAKHFPGIGDVHQDPHRELPTVSQPAERLRDVEILPFRRAIEHGVAGVMTAHVNFTAFDSDWPGTLSRKILTELLRDELGFAGLILTDDMEMGAVTENYQIGPAAVRAVRAGADIILICHRADRIREAREALLEAFRSGQIGKKRLEATSARLDKIYKKLPEPDPASWEKIFK
ncbi:MAG: beta-N-acetylhexosaminidase [Deltaproteobacteria bacterium]|nr:beta-N-acetylhexosaminidase [Deltaproteobacteria bacterium]MBW2140317.1 beta-N-acetylhexosaminidase [Deltaproteobacteria bacterium]MBW2323549.1 beta-N-acetylhexosaminidase [Deltaproteobacteria bacterium]